MSEPTLKRWRDQDAPPVVLAAAAAHHSIGPDAALLEHMLANVEATIASADAAASSEPSSPSSAPAAATVSRGLFGKLLIGVAVAALGIGAWGSRAERAEHTPAGAVQAAPVAVLANTPSLAPAAAPAPSSAAPPLRLPTPRTLAPVAAKRAAMRREKRLPHAQTPAPAQPQASELGKGSSALEELSLLRRARRVLAGNPRLALSLSEEHAARFVSAAFGEERDVIAVEALLALGRRAEAERRADHFRSQHPASLHLRRIDVLLARPE